MSYDPDSCTAPVSEEVKTLQRCLRRLGYFPTYSASSGGPIKINGKFCVYTQKAVRSFQEAQGLSVTGACNQETIAKLQELLCPPVEVTEKEDEALEKAKEKLEEYRTAQKEANEQKKIDDAKKLSEWKKNHV